MLLGKRPRAPIMKRTTSMSGGLAVETKTSKEEEVLMSDNMKLVDPQVNVVAMGTPNDQFVPNHTKNVSQANGSYVYGDRLMGMGVNMSMPLSPTTSNNHRHHMTHNHTTNTNNIHTTSHFLRTCGLCNCHLAPGRDIYMYRGDTAFCSLECREKQMKQDQRKEKWKAGSNKEHHRASPPGATAKASCN